MEKSEYALGNHPETYCHDREDYVRIALALETLAYHNKNYLDSSMCDNAKLSREIQALLMEFLKGENS